MPLAFAARDGSARAARRIGCVAIPAALLVAQVPQQLDAGRLLIGVVVVVVALPMAAIGLAASARVWVAVVGLAMMVMVPVASVALVDTPLFGPTVTGPVSGAAGHRWARGYRFTDATVRLDLGGTGTVAFRGGRATSSSTFAVAPVVPPGWVPGRPVQVWLVVDGDRLPASGPTVDMARLVGWADPVRAQVVRDVARRGRLVAAPDLLLVRPVPDPPAWLDLAAACAAFAGAWLLLVLVGRPRTAPPTRPRPASGPPRR